MRKKIICSYDRIEYYQVVLYLNIYNYRLLRKVEVANAGFTLDGIGLSFLIRLFRLPAQRLNPDYSGYLGKYLSGKRVHIYAASLDELLSFASRKHDFDTISMLDGYSTIDKFHKVIAPNLEEGDVVLVGRGTPLQEKTIGTLSAQYNRVQFIAVGAFISQFSRGNNYYPLLVDKLHLRMPYRMIRERLYDRLGSYIINPLIFIYDGLFYRAFMK